MQRGAAGTKGVLYKLQPAYDGGAGAPRPARRGRSAPDRAYPHMHICVSHTRELKIVDRDTQEILTPTPTRTAHGTPSPTISNAV